MVPGGSRQLLVGPLILAVRLVPSKFKPAHFSLCRMHYTASWSHCSEAMIN